MGSVLFLKKHVRAQLLRETTIGLANNAEIDHRSLCTRGVTCKCAVHKGLQIAKPARANKTTSQFSSIWLKPALLHNSYSSYQLNREGLIQFMKQSILGIRNIPTKGTHASSFNVNFLPSILLM